MAKKSRKKLYKECEEVLILKKEEISAGLAQIKQILNPEISGDAGDMSKAIEQRHTAAVKRDRYEVELREVESALERIKVETYGYCEETGEEIQEKRLKAIPWTRYSIEGQEIRERNKPSLQ